MTVEEPGTAAVAPPRRGLAIASLTVGAATIVLAVSAWFAWLLVLPRLSIALHHSWLSVAFGLVVGAIWFATLPAGVVAAVLGLTSGARLPGGDNLGRVGAFLGLLSFTVGLVGAVVFVLHAGAWGPPRFPTWEPF
ncbi:hypothetical protein [Amycolatopsis minnesotensis]|uniref:Uncharacterized protein n=1 Tax=Amycolatopsis minnesotensis TaxID=337894 RepID=A0ABN2QU76_9PSEU